MAWQHIVVADTDGTPLGDVRNIKDRRLSYRLRRPCSGGFTVPLEHRLSDRLLDGDVLVKMYEQDDALVPVFGDDTVLRYCGPVDTAEEVGSADTLAVTLTDALGDTCQDDRLVGKSVDGYHVTEQIEGGQVIADLLNTLNAESNTLLRPGTIESTSVVQEVGPWRYKPFGECLSELANRVDGFDYWVEHVEPTVDEHGPFCGLLNIAPSQGQLRPSAVFAYGIQPFNVKDYQRPVTRRGMATDAYALPPGFPDNIPAGDSVVTDSDSVARGFYRRREQVIASDLEVQELRQKLVQNHVAVRSVPRQTIAITPQPRGYEVNGRPVRVPHYMVDFFDGDIVPVRIVKHDRVRADALMRVYGADVALSESGLATITPHVTPTQ